MKANVFKPILTFFLGCLFFFSASAGILPEGYYTIRLASSGKHLDVHSGAIEANSTPFHLWSKANNLSQTFKLEEIQGGVYLIKAAGSNKAMDASWNQRNQNGCPVIIWDKNKGETQGWKIRRISGDKYAITLNSNGKALSGSISNYTQNAGKVQLWTQMAQYKNLQEWVIEPLKKVIRSSKYVDLRANQSPYKHQKLNVANDRGSCTYFATLAALEAAYLKKGRRNLDLSEEAWSIYAKMLGIHPFWADNTHANWRENQFARTQGGGSIKLLAAGVRVPQERYARYIAEHGDIDWGNRNQKICNDFNFRTLTPAIQNAPLSYGVKSYRELSSRSAPEIEGILRQGYEIVMGINKGGHVLLFVGYDKTDPNNKRFIVKNSYVAPKSNGQWVESWELVDYLSYDELPDLRGGAYIVDVHDPAPWKEAKILGRWNFDYDGWKGTLDIHHLPGLMNTFFDDTEAVRRNGKAILDHRLGTYYDRNGKAFRVNGKIIKNGASSKLVFYINFNKPNLRWDEISGTRFEYVINGKMDFMAGFHEADGKTYGGYASKTTSYQAGNFNIANQNASKFAGQRFRVRIGQLDGYVRFGSYVSHSGGYVQGELTDSRGYKTYLRVFNVNELLNGFKVVRYSNATASNQLEAGKVRYHSWEQGVLSGKAYVNASYTPMLLVKQ